MIDKRGILTYTNYNGARGTVCVLILQYKEEVIVLICENCLAEIPGGSDFCIICGAKTGDDFQNTIVKKPEMSDKHFSLEDIAKQQGFVANDSPGMSAIGMDDETDTPYMEPDMCSETALPSLTADDSSFFSTDGSLPPLQGAGRLSMQDMQSLSVSGMPMRSDNELKLDADSFSGLYWQPQENNDE